MEREYSYKKDGVVLNINSTGILINTWVASSGKGKYGFELYLRVRNDAHLFQDYEFMHALLYRKSEIGPLAYYVLDNTDELIAFVDDLQRRGERLAVYLVQNGVLDANQLTWDCDSTQELVKWGVPQLVVDQLLRACNERHRDNIEDALVVVKAHILRIHRSEAKNPPTTDAI